MNTILNAYYDNGFNRVVVFIYAEGTCNTFEVLCSFKGVLDGYCIQASGTSDTVNYEHGKVIAKGCKLIGFFAIFGFKAFNKV